MWAGYVRWVIIYGVSPDNAGRVLFRADGLHSNSGSAGIGGLHSNSGSASKGFVPTGMYKGRDIPAVITGSALGWCEEES